jgi:hypothetical protein
MAIQFPINPQQGQQYTPAGIPLTWQYDSGRHAWRVLRTGPLWDEIGQKPNTFPPSAHQHPIADVTNLQQSLNNKQDSSARTQPNGYPSLDADGLVPTSQLPPLQDVDWPDITNKPGTFPPSPHSHPVVEISDSTSVGQQLVRAPTPLDARNVIGALGADDNARVNIKKAGTSLGIRRAINFIEGLNVTLAISDDAINEEVDVTINSAGGGGGGASLVVSEVKPAAPADSSLWLDAATGICYVYYNDGTNKQWIESLPYLTTQPAAFTKISFPSSPVNDQIFTAFAGAQWKWSTSRGVWYAVSQTGSTYTKAEADAKFVDVIGDTMTGALTLNADPTAPLQAVTKQYVDSRPGIVISDTPPPAPLDNMLWWESDVGTLYIRYNDGTGPSQWVQAVATPMIDTSGFILRSGDTMGGHLSLPQFPAAANAVRKDYVDAYAAPLDAMAYSGMQINGSMEVSQELGSSGSSASAASIGDGWRIYRVGTSAVTAALQVQNLFSGLPSNIGMAVTTAQPTMGAGDIMQLYQFIEGYRVSRLAWGTVLARPITLAFWTMHHRTGTYTGTVMNGAQNRCYPFTYQQNAADTQEYKVITIPGCTDGTWAKDNTAGMLVVFAMAMGATNTAPSANSWLTSSYSAAPGQVNAVASTSDAFRMSGFVVLPGSQAPTAAQSPLIMRPYDQELATCKRYFEQSWQTTLADTRGCGAVTAINASRFIGSVLFTVQKRATPTFNIWSPVSGNQAYIWVPGIAEPALSAYPAATQINVGTIWDTTGSVAVGHTGVFHWRADARL